MVSVRGRDRRSQARPRSPSDGPGRRRPLAAIAVIVLVSGLVLFGLDPFGMVGDAQQPGGVSVAAAPSGSAPAGSVSTATPENEAQAPPPIPGHEVYGFVPYWEMDDGIAKHLAKTDLTTLALFSVTHRSSGRMQDNQTGYRRITGDLGQQLIREAHERGTRVEVVYTSFGEAKNRTFYGSDKAQSRWIEELVDFAEEQGFDGINVDVGAPARRPRAGVRGIRRAACARPSASGCPMPRSPSPRRAGLRGAAMAAAATAAGADRIFLMGYDYHWPGSEPGASAPMDRLDGEDRDLPWSLDLYADARRPGRADDPWPAAVRLHVAGVRTGDRCAVAGPR